MWCCCCFLQNNERMISPCVFSEYEVIGKDNTEDAVEVSGVTIPKTAYDEGKLTITI